MRTLFLFALALSSTAQAADHAEAPGAASDSTADIADYFAFVDDGTFVAAITFSPLSTDDSGKYDADVLYTIHIDHDQDAKSDLDLHFRFGQNSAGEWGVQAVNIPGAPGPVEGAVESNLEWDGHHVWAGIRDDPFFFDITGFQETLATGTLAFDSSRDALAGFNVTAIVISGPVATFNGGSNTITTWATTARK